MILSAKCEDGPDSRSGMLRPGSNRPGGVWQGLVEIYCKTLKNNSFVWLGCVRFCSDDHGMYMINR